MLSQVFIKNYALITQTTLSFTKGLTIITGETGAGKSILLEALGLVLGKRADKSALRDEKQKCIIEAQFDNVASGLEPFFEENDLDFETSTIIRREILPSGKSRIFVNDSPTTLQVVSALGKHLMDIHSQHQTQDLFQESYHLQILDALAENTSLIKDYQKYLEEYKEFVSEIQKLEHEKALLEREQDYHSFLLQELTDAQLKVGEQEELEAEVQTLGNVEFVEDALQKGHLLLTEEQYGVFSALREILSSLQKIKEYSSEYAELFERTQSAEIELKDISDDIYRLQQRLEQDPEKLELISAKLQLLYQLQKKHQVTTVAELILIQTDLEQQMFRFEGIDGQLQSLREKQEQHIHTLNTLGQKIGSQRNKAIPILVSQLQKMVAPLGMANATFEYRLSNTSHFYPNGMDTLEVYFSANKGMPFAPLKKSASGGEMSRIMLAVKAILAEFADLPTIIFDEIDTGVSGDVADKMGDIMRQMSQHMQVFAITHLPQVAAKGTEHFNVVKDQLADKTETTIVKLNTHQRIEEVAQMLSGNQVTEAALIHAKNLLQIS